MGCGPSRYMRDKEFEELKARASKLIAEGLDRSVIKIRLSLTAHQFRRLRKAIEMPHQRRREREPWQI